MSLEQTAYIASKINKNNLADTNVTFSKMVQLLKLMLKTGGGSSTAAALNALTNPMPGLLITITTGGTLTLGSLVVITDDTVYFNHDTGIWTKAEWVQNVDPTAALIADTALTAAMGGMLFLVGADAKTATLPSSATVGAGIRYAFINNGTDGSYGFTITPNSIDKIMGSFNNGDVKIVMTGTNDKDIVNTKATARRGDYLVLISDGVDGWYIEDGHGIWTEESVTANDTLRNPEVVETVIVDKTLDAADSGKTFLMGTAAKTFTLPATVAGLRYKFVNSGAAANNIITISPAAADKIMGTIVNGGRKLILSGTNDKDIINTAATAQKGDYVVLVGDGVDGWYVEDSVGIWAEESVAATEMVQNPKTVEVITTTKSIDIYDTGKTFILDGVAGAVISLPAVATSSGFYAKFIVGDAIATTDWTILAATNVIQGSALVDGAHVASVNQNTISFVVATATLGDFVELECDGTNWYANGSCVAAGGVTFTAA